LNQPIFVEGTSEIYDADFALIKKLIHWP